jgi:hypothetical protein
LRLETAEKTGEYQGDIVDAGYFSAPARLPFAKSVTTFAEFTL